MYLSLPSTITTFLQFEEIYLIIEKCEKFCSLMLRKGKKYGRNKKKVILCKQLFGS